MGLALAEVLVALSLLASIGVAAATAGQALARLEDAARAEAAGLALASAKIEELSALPAARRSDGNDEVELAGVRVTRIWRSFPDRPAPGLTRLEVTARWSEPRLTLLTLVALAP